MLCLCLALGGSLSLISPSAAQSDAFDSSSLTVNVELVLDVSGSMAEVLPGTDNQTRMDAAKEALLAVINQIPERPGLNVGLRVYGHVGSNLQADQAVSCATTSLLVPIAGVDRGALIREVRAVQPTGWTPLAQALEDASADFAPGESVTNAVIMVTDGEETCGGDPCVVARALHASGIELTTHVVGFALTEAQQDAVRCIAEEGGGQLFTAADAASLSQAVFSALAQVETAPVTGGVVVGNAFDVLGVGVPGELAVVAAGLENDTTLLLVARNDTTETVEHVEATVNASRGGASVGSGTTALSAPYVVEPGGVALLQVFFPDGGLTATDDFDVTFSFDALGTTDPVIRGAALLVDHVAPNESGLDVVQRNPYPFAIGPNQYQYAMCFDATGTPHHYVFDTTVLTEVPPGATAPELIADYRAAECPYYLVTTAGDPAVELGEAPLVPPVAAPRTATPVTAAPRPRATVPAGQLATGAGPVTPPGTVEGTAFGALGAGVPGELAAVAAGIDDTDTMLLVIQNNTGATVEHVQVTVSAQIGAETATGATIHVAPYEVPAGGVALVEVFFAEGGLTEQTDVTVEITSDPAGTTPPRARFETDLVVEQISLDSLGATIDVRNPYPVAIGPNQYLYLMCFDATGTPDHLAFDTEVLSDIPANGTKTLQLADPRIDTCGQFLAAVTGEPPR